MTSEAAYEEAFVWIWLPGETRPVVAGRLADVVTRWLETRSDPDVSVDE